MFSFTLSKSDQLGKLAHLNALTPAPAKFFQAELFEVASAFHALEQIRIEMLQHQDENHLELEQTLRYFQASASSMAISVFDHWFSAPPSTISGLSRDDYHELSKSQRTALTSTCPNVDVYNDSKLVAATKWHGLDGIEGHDLSGRGAAWKAIYQLALPSEKRVR